MEVNSYDLFDTLIFRTCYDPQNIFEFIETERQVPHFKENRIKYQLNNLYDTYKNLQLLYNWDDITRDNMMEYEMYVEEEHIYPIWVNIRKINPTVDIIVSDMYLPEYFIEKILLKFNINNKLYLTNSGKYDGYIWDIIKKDGFIVKTHYGDNNYSDINMPKKYGINTIKLTHSLFTDYERKIDRNVALCVRFCRLQSKYQERELFNDIYMAGCSANISILLYYSQYIYNYCIDNKFDKLLFTTRDCVYLYLVFNSIYGSRIKSTIFFSSRFCYNNSDEKYNAYVDSLLGNKTLVIDMQGSGKSFKAYFIDNRHKSNIHLLFFNTGSVLVRHPNIKSLFHDDKKISDNIEMLNLVSFGSVYGISDDLVPCFSELEYPHYLIEPIIQYIKHLLVYINKFYKNTKIEYNVNYFEYNLNNIYLLNLQKETKHGLCVYKDYIRFRQIFGINMYDDNFNFDDGKYIKKDISDISCVLIHQNKQYKRIGNMKNVFNKMGINFNNVKIVEPFGASENTKQVLMSKLSKKTRLKNSLTQSSHFLTYLSIMEFDFFESDDLFIFEDDLKPIYDTNIMNNMLEFIINNYPADADMIYLEYCSETCSPVISNFTRLIKPYCTGCIYYPSKKSRNKILSCIYNYYLDAKNDVADSTDGIIAYLINTKQINAYTHTPLFTQDVNFGSTIEGSTKDEHSFCNNNNLNIFSDMFNRIENRIENRMTKVYIILCIIIIFIVIYFTIYYKIYS